jgi:5-formyltetrahydrofolate cyclo-ligase
MEDNSINNAKSLLRLSYKDIRSKIPSEENLSSSNEIKKIFINWLQSYSKPKPIIAGYYPINHELNILPLLIELENLGYICALPRMIRPEKLLEFKEWHPNDELELSKNIYEPLATALNVSPDIIITPLLAFDLHGHRLGYGQGFYDKTISFYRSTNPNLVAIGLGHYKQFSPNVLPTHHHDQILNLIITEKGIFQPEF